MNKDSSIFLQHILNEINKIEKSTNGLLKEDFKKNEDIQDAIFRRIEIIGEAVKNLPISFKEKYTKIPWQKIVGARDKLIHHYFGVDLDAVWDMIEVDAPLLKKQIQEILTKEKFN